MSAKQKLELTWIGKDKRPKLEPRILVEIPEKSYHAEVRHGDKDQFENMLIHGDNLLALKALEQEFTGKVKCIYIDPPYNTGSAFEHYDDGIEHSLWLNLMRERLEILRTLLSEDGSIYVNIDFNECHYLKVLMDEIFGRECFQREIIWRIGWLSGFKTSANNYIRNHDTILFYTKRPSGFYFNKDAAYNYPDDFQERFNSQTKKDILNRLLDLKVPKAEAKKLLDFISTAGLPNRYPLEDTWNCSIYDKLNSIAVVSFSGEKVSKMLGAEEFKGQKAELLIRRILSISTKPGDLVLDSFLGTGTTAAVAHKMGRRWIGIELGEHASTLAKPRLERVINGQDQSGITAKENWQGGGGFRFYELGASLIRQDQWGQPVINPEFNAEMLAQALCKLEGFTYDPSKEEYFIHGHSSEHDFIYVTTNFMRTENLQSISEQLGNNRSLLICCRGFESTVKFGNLTIKKIPKAVLDKCEWGHDDYSLNVKNLPMSSSEPVLEQGELFSAEGDEK